MQKTYKNTLTTKPCPFCGCGHLSTIFNEVGDGSSTGGTGVEVEVFVRCNECNAQGPILFVGEKIDGFDADLVEDSIKIWNDRHTSDGFTGFTFTEDMIPTELKDIFNKIKPTPKKKPSSVDELKDRISEGAEKIKEATNEKIDSIRDSISDRLQDLASKLKK